MQTIIRVSLIIVLFASFIGCVPKNNAVMKTTASTRDKISGLRLNRAISFDKSTKRSGLFVPANNPVDYPDNPEISTGIPKPKNDETNNLEALKIGVLLFPVDLDYTQYMRQQAVEDAFKAVAENGEINPIFEIPTVDRMNFDSSGTSENQKAIMSFTQKALDSAKKLASDPSIELVVGAGEPVGSILLETAKRYPKKHFLILDVAEADFGKGFNNVKTIRCKVEEAAYLCGVLAVNNSPNGNFGFVGYRLDNQTLSYYAGFRAGAKFSRPGAIVRYMFIENPYNQGSLPPIEATQRNLSVFIRGNDMIFENAGLAYIITLNTCTKFSKRAFASVVNKDEEYSRTVMTSALVNYGPLIQYGLASSIGESFSPGKVEWGLKEGVVGITDMKTIRRYMKLSDDGLQAVNQAYKDISSGQTKVPAATEELYTRLKRDITEQSSVKPR